MRGSESHAWYQERERERKGEGSDACRCVQKLIAAIVELGSGVTRRSTWYRG